MAGGEMVSQGPLEPLFQVRILARQPGIRAGVEVFRLVVSGTKRQ
jgi:hypothetical protein